MTSKAFTTSSDRIKAARKALSALESDIETWGSEYGRGDIMKNAADALRALITPPAVGEMPDLEDLYARAHQRALPSDSGLFTVLDLDQADAAGKLAIFRAGIQAAHAAWGQAIDKEENR